MATTIGRLLIEDALPPDLRPFAQTLELDKKGIQKLLTEVATKHPDQYREVTHKLMKLGAEASTISGSYSFGLNHLMPAKAALQYRQQIESQIDRILTDPNIPPSQKEQQIIRVAGNAGPEMEKAIYEDSLAEGNPLAKQIQSGAKGSPGNLRSLRGGDLLYTDSSGELVPIPVLRSYSEGLTPAEYWAGTYGARQGVTTLKLGTAEAGFLAKQLSQAAHRLVVTARDSDKPHDPFRPTGLPVPVDDPDNEGAFLAHAAGPYQRNTLLTPRILADLRSKGIDNILVRSPLVGGPADGGVYALDAGIRERAQVAPIGDFVGITAANAFAEPMSQSTIGAKHGGGVAGAGKGASGYKLIDKLVNTPKVFQGGASHAQIDGVVSRVEDAPQGGKYVTVGGQKHYVAVGHDVVVKPGQEVEAGDALSDGIPNPAEIVHHKGIGEGRRQFVNQLMSASKSSGFSPNRRNLELIARGLIDHVRLTKELGQHVPDDIVPYSSMAYSYQPRPGHQIPAPKDAVGKYLETPVLHYTVGTRITHSAVKALERHGIQSVIVHDDPPPFEPVMVRGRDNLGKDEDWMVRLMGSNLEKNLLRGAHLGDVSDESGTSFVPSLAKGLGFGTTGTVKGFKPGK